MNMKVNRTANNWWWHLQSNFCGWCSYCLCKRL